MADKVQRNKKEEKKLRINKYLAQYGGFARREADRLVIDGRVTLNGAKMRTPGQLVIVGRDKVKVRKKLIQDQRFKAVYYIFHKPENVLTTTKDSKNRPIVTDYLKKVRVPVFSVGRLDWNSEGLLLFTNDGDFSQRVLHPKNKVFKTYLVKVKGQPSSSQLLKLQRGVTTSVGRVRVLYVQKGSQSLMRNAWVKVILQEGKKRQIRLMFQKIGFLVTCLRRVAIGRLKLGRLPKGAVKSLSLEEVSKAFVPPKELGRFPASKPFSKK